MNRPTKRNQAETLAEISMRLDELADDLEAVAFEVSRISPAAMPTRDVFFLTLLDAAGAIGEARGILRGTRPRSADD